MMSTLGVGRGIPTKQTRVLISCVSVTVTKGESGSENPKILLTSYEHAP